MDPRRAADPRLARDPRRAQDPRLQRAAASTDLRARSDSPLPPPPVNTTVATTHAPQPLSVTAPPVLSESVLVKQRPLFCIVCASNQVCLASLLRPVADSPITLTPTERIALWRDTTY